MSSLFIATSQLLCGLDAPAPEFFSRTWIVGLRLLERLQLDLQLAIPSAHLIIVILLSTHSQKVTWRIRRKSRSDPSVMGRIPRGSETLSRIVEERGELPQAGNVAISRKARSLPGEKERSLSQLCVQIGVILRSFLEGTIERVALESGRDMVHLEFIVSMVGALPTTEVEPEVEDVVAQPQQGVVEPEEAREGVSAAEDAADDVQSVKGSVPNSPPEVVVLEVDAENPHGFAFTYNSA
ncbi:unnamed protein product [Cochlearia groenlandica]